MRQYDYIIAGGGCAGLSLAFQLNKTELRNRSILIIDRGPKVENDRTWCFWSNEATDFESIVKKQWRNVIFAGQDFIKNIPLLSYSYKLIRGIDFYNFTQSELRQNPNIEWVYGEIENVKDVSDGAVVRVNGQDFMGNWLFNSVFDFKNLQQDKSRYFYQLQHFKGWIIHTEKPQFDPEQMHLMDYRTPQLNSSRFFYVLPFDEHKALIEYTIFSEALLEKHQYDGYLKTFIAETLKIDSYTIEEVEFGVIPMTNHPLKKSGGQHIINIGTLGGQVKASTGYAFQRIQEESKQIVENLLAKDTPFYSTSILKKRFTLYDTLLLHILQYNGGLIKVIFTELFKRNKVKNVFLFLGEKTTILQEIRIFFSLPSAPFLKALFKVYIKKPILSLFK